MILLPFRRSRRTLNIDALYGMIVAQARLPAFYQAYGVPDTVDGRLDMLILHLVLLVRRLNQGQAKGPAAVVPAGQLLFNRFCQDIDGNFREMGIGDLKVPQEMRRVAGAFYGRSKAYETALEADDQGLLEAAIARNVFGTAPPPLGARRLAAYMRDADRRLAAQDMSAADGAVLQIATLDFPQPDAVTQP